ncbi:hypothetical protein Pan216_18850 [Planctomycetes bacterium Pan216]|uniref:Uncharacterized protein n=1 Tax=Kolteria novifilia TaxID=2527975 RepID=A0A518B269_9BACT|nr:hypothetical protein Pan216_18850 [Planctomycetes bacterium Pan216]
MVDDEEKKRLIEEYQRDWNTAESQVNSTNSALRMWNRVLTVEERQSLGGDIKKLDRHYDNGGTARIYMQLRNCSYTRAVLELARDLELLSERTANEMLHIAGESEDGRSTSPKSRPVWDRERGQLLFGGQLVRRVSIKEPPTNIELILNSFDEEGWPGQIDDPLPAGPNRKRLEDTIRSLNRGLRFGGGPPTIRFHLQGSGTAISWKPLNSGWSSGPVR